MRSFFAFTILALFLLPSTAVAVEPCADPDLGIYAESRLRAGLRPTHRCTENQARYLRGLYGDAQRAYAKRVREYRQWLNTLPEEEEEVISPSTDIRSSRRTYRTIRRR